MRCPRCGVELWSPERVCFQCGQDTTLAAEVEKLTREIQLTQNDFQLLTTRLASLQEALGSLPKILADHGEVATSKADAPTAAPTPVPIADPEPIPAPPPPAEPSRSPIPEKVEKWVKTQEHGEDLEESPWQELDESGVPTVRKDDTTQRDFEHDPFLDRAAELQLGQKWLLIIGIVVMVLGVGYFLKYAFDRNWIGPAGRVACAYGVGAACLLAGEKFRRKGLPLFGLYLMGGGIAVLYFSGYAAFQIYDLISQPTAFALMVGVTILAGLLSLKFDIMWLAVLGIIGGFVTPMVLSTKQDNQIGLMTYMTILNAGIVWIAAFKRWGVLNQLGFSFTWALFSAWFAAHYDVSKFVRTIVFLNVYFVAYAIVPFAYYFVPRGEVQRPGFAITLVNTAVAFGFSYVMIQRYASTQWISAVSLAYGAFYSGMAYSLRRRNPGSVDAFILLLGMALLFFIITIPLYFSGHWITVAWAVQAAVLLWAAIRIGDFRLYAGGLALLSVVICRYVLHDAIQVFELNLSKLSFRSGYSALAAQRWATSVCVLGATYAVATMLRRAKENENLPGMKEARDLAYAVFGIMFFAVLNVEVSAWFYDYAPSARFAAISVLWALCALCLMILGFWNHLVVLRGTSLVLFGATLLKVFLWDMAKVSTPYRIISFLVLGLMLIGASYLYHRYRSTVDSFKDATPIG